MDAETSSLTTKKALREVVSEHWKLDKLALDYAAFIKLFSPLEQAIARGAVPTPQEAFQARLLLIHGIPSHSAQGHATARRFYCPVAGGGRWHGELSAPCTRLSRTPREPHVVVSYEPAG